MTDPFALVGTVLDRRFAIDRAVARGGFGIVYQARHINLKRPAAIKVLVMPRGLNTREKRVFLEGFEREAQTVAALDHPAIVRAYDFGISREPERPDLPWLALEWVEGESLAQRLVARGAAPFTPAEALSVLRPVFDALSYAHELGVAHRDIKPAHVILTGGRHGAAAARLLDFGVAKVMAPEESVGSGQTRTMAAFRAFTSEYAAPEQKVGARTGPWTDVHALGLVLTEMLTGRAPYPTGNRMEIEQHIMAPTRPTPARFGVDVGAWEPVLARALSLRAPERFERASALLDALLASVPERPPSTAAT
ncbi:MAG: serine/threonine-protein kinase [Polyangiales bacterium]